MLDYALKLTRDPGGMTAADAEALRDAGFGDRAVLDICQVASYYNYVNRLADGLGVQLEEHWRDEDCTLRREEFEALREARRAGAVERAGTGERAGAGRHAVTGDQAATSESSAP